MHHSSDIRRRHCYRLSIARVVCSPDASEADVLANVVHGENALSGHGGKLGGTYRGTDISVRVSTRYALSERNEHTYAHQLCCAATDSRRDQRFSGRSAERRSPQEPPRGGPSGRRSRLPFHQRGSTACPAAGRKTCYRSWRGRAGVPCAVCARRPRAGTLGDEGNWRATLQRL